MLKYYMPIKEFKKIHLSINKEALFIDKEVNELVSSIRNTFKLDVNCIYNYDLSIDSVESLLTQLNTLSLFGEKKIIIVNNPTFLETDKSLSEEEKKGLYEYFMNPVDDNILILKAKTNKLDINLEYLAPLSKHIGDLEEYCIEKASYQVEQFKGFFRRSFDSSYIIDDDAIDEYVNIARIDLYNAENEITKLKLYGEKHITVDVIRNVVSKSADVVSFELVKCIVKNEKRKALIEYKNINHNKLNLTDIFFSIIGSVKLTYLYVSFKNSVSEEDLCKLLEIKKGRLHFLKKDYSSVKLKAIEDLLLKVSLLDYKLKSGILDANGVFDSLMYL